MADQSSFQPSTPQLYQDPYLQHQHPALHPDFPCIQAPRLGHGSYRPPLELLESCGETSIPSFSNFFRGSGASRSRGGTGGDREESLERDGERDPMDGGGRGGGSGGAERGGGGRLSSAGLKGVGGKGGRRVGGRGRKEMGGRTGGRGRRERGGRLAGRREEAAGGEGMKSTERTMAPPLQMTSSSETLREGGGRRKGWRRREGGGRSEEAVLESSSTGTPAPTVEEQ